MPHFVAVAGRDVGGPHGDRVAAFERRLGQPGFLRDRVGPGRRRSRRAAAGATCTSRRPAGASGRAGAPASGRRTRRQPDAATAALRLLRERRARAANERDVLAVGGPERLAVAIGGRRQVLHRARRDVVDADERVIHARRHERDLPAVGRPRGRAVRAPLLDERRLAAIHRARGPRGCDLRPIDLPVAHDEHRAAVRRDARVRAGDHAPRRARRRHTRGPHRFFRAVRIAEWIRVPALTIRVAASHEDDRRSVVGNLQAGEIDAVVFHERREPHRRECRRGGGIDVAAALVVRNPRDAIDPPGRNDFDRRRRAEELRGGQLRGRRSGPGRGAGKQCGGGERDDDRAGVGHGVPPDGADVTPMAAPCRPDRC